MRSVGPVPKFSPLIVTFVHEMPSLGEMPVTRGGCRARDMMSFQLLKTELLLSVQQENNLKTAITLCKNYLKPFKLFF